MDDPTASRLWQTQAHIVGWGRFDGYSEGGLLRTLHLSGGQVRLARCCSRANGLCGYRNRRHSFRFGWWAGGSSRFCSSSRLGDSSTILPIALFSPELLHLLPQTVALGLLAAQPGTQLFPLCVKLRQLFLHLGLHLLATLPLCSQLLLQPARGATLLIEAGLELVEALRLLHHPCGKLLALTHQHHDDVLVLLALVLKLRRQLAMLLLQTLELQLLHLQLEGKDTQSSEVRENNANI